VFLGSIIRKYWGKIIFSLIFASIPLFIKNDYYLHLLIMAGFYILLTEGLNLIVGYVGELSLGHQAFLGIGAYVSAIFALRLGAPFWLSFVAAGIIGGLISFGLGYITLRLRGAYFVIVTICFAGIIHLITLNSDTLTGGPMGLGGIPAPMIAIGSWKLEVSTKTSYYYFIFGLVLATLYLCYRIVNSRLGRACIGIRENEELAESLGISAFRYTLMFSIIGGILASIAGSFYAYYVSFVSPELMSFHQMVTMLLMLVIGGRGTVIGPVIGAILFTIIPEYLRAVAQFRMPIYGLLLISAILITPRGIVPAIANLWDARKGMLYERIWKRKDITNARP
jgi:branched-chain amino acid transport system permease protein